METPTLHINDIWLVPQDYVSHGHFGDELLTNGLSFEVKIAFCWIKFGKRSMLFLPLRDLACKEKLRDFHIKEHSHVYPIHLG